MVFFLLLLVGGSEVARIVFLGTGPGARMWLSIVEETGNREGKKRRDCVCGDVEFSVRSIFTRLFIRTNVLWQCLECSVPILFRTIYCDWHNSKWNETWWFKQIWFWRSSYLLALFYSIFQGANSPSPSTISREMRRWTCFIWVTACEPWTWTPPWPRSRRSAEPKRRVRRLKLIVFIYD